MNTGQHPTNTFALRAVIRNSESRYGERSSLVYGQILVDSELVSEKYATDWRHIAWSSHHSGQYFPFTCGCGDRRCAEIEKPVDVVHRGGTVLWRVREPLPLRTWVFERRAYRRAIVTGLRDALRLAAGAPHECEIGPLDYEVRDLDECLKHASGLRLVWERDAA